MNWETVDTLRNKHYGSDIFVLGTSGSLAGIDPNLLKGKVVIGTNDAAGWFAVNDVDFHPQYLLTVDLSATQRAFADVKMCPNMMLVTRERVAKFVRDRKLDNPMCVFDVTTKKKMGMLFHGPFEQTDNTALYSVELAMRMRGITVPGRIILVGVDLRYPTDEERAKGVKDHYWGDGQIDGCRNSFTGPLQKLPRIVEMLNKKNIQLVTASTWSGPLTEILPWVTLESML
jgi:hypothetical protein